MAIFPNLCVPAERDLRFASTGSNYNPRNTQCMDACPAVFKRGVFFSPSLILEKIPSFRSDTAYILLTPLFSLSPTPFQ
jgi:hypothetical protein